MRTPRQTRTNRFVPRLVELEDRRTPATFTVTTGADVVSPTDGKLSLREAITAANLTPEADRILLRAGVYKIGLAGSGEDQNATGDFDITASVTITGLGADRTVIDAGGLDRVFHAVGTPQAPIAVAFGKLTIRNGLIAGDSGAGIMARNAGLRLTDAAVTYNRAGVNGGGINNPGAGPVSLLRTVVNRNTAGNAGGGIFGAGSIDIVGGTVARNFADKEGGGIFSFGPATLTGTVVRENVAAERDGGGLKAPVATLVKSSVLYNRAAWDGGGIRLYDSSFTPTEGATIVNSVIRGNQAGLNGGGLYAVAGSVAITKSTVAFNTAGVSGGGAWANVPTTLTGATVTGNRARNDGGGLFCAVALTVQASAVTDNASGTSGGGIAVDAVTLSGTTVDGNTTNGFGGGVSARAATITQSTISHNSAAGLGGGVLATTIDFANVTVSGNTSVDHGGGVFADAGTVRSSTIVENVSGGLGGGFRWSGTGANVAFQNTIIAQNFALVGSPDVSGGTSLGNNLVGDATLNGGFGAAGDRTGTDANPLDPMLGALRNNGGTTWTHAPRAGSPAVDAGNSAAPPAADQRGRTRIRDGNGDGTRVVDIGAVER
jgi:CSLREA domain-containing protein